MYLYNQCEDATHNSLLDSKIKNLILTMVVSNKSLASDVDEKMKKLIKTKKSLFKTKDTGFYYMRSKVLKEQQQKKLAAISICCYVVLRKKQYKAYIMIVTCIKFAYLAT